MFRRTEAIAIDKPLSILGILSPEIIDPVVVALHLGLNPGLLEAISESRLS
jgi:hypothetical protein